MLMPNGVVPTSSAAVVTVNGPTISGPMAVPGMRPVLSECSVCRFCCHVQCHGCHSFRLCCCQCHVFTLSQLSFCHVVAHSIPLGAVSGN